MEIEQLVLHLVRALVDRKQDTLHNGTDVYKIVIHNVNGEDADFIELAYTDEPGILHST